MTYTKPSCSRTSGILLRKLVTQLTRALTRAHDPTQHTLPRPHHMWHVPLGPPHAWANPNPTWSRIGVLFGSKLGTRTRRESGRGYGVGMGVPWVVLHGLLVLLGDHKVADPIRVSLGAYFPYIKACIQGHNY